MHSRNEIFEQIKLLAADKMTKNSHIYLYGSRARGDAREDSDWDLLVLLDKPEIEQSDYDGINYSITELGWNLGEALIPVMYTIDEWNGNYFTPFYKNVTKEGILII